MSTIAQHSTSNGLRDGHRGRPGRCPSARDGQRATVPRPELREIPRERWAAAPSENLRTGLSGFLDFDVVAFVPDRIAAVLPLRDELMMATGDFLHAGTVVAFADSLAGWGCLASLPDHAEGFTTAELKANLEARSRPCSGRTGRRAADAHTHGVSALCAGPAELMLGTVGDRAGLRQLTAANASTPVSSAERFHRRAASSGSTAYARTQPGNGSMSLPTISAISQSSQ
jgi:hypothetical protein